MYYYIISNIKINYCTKTGKRFTNKKYHENAYILGEKTITPSLKIQIFFK